jgi:hypothetical protein
MIDYGEAGGDIILFRNCKQLLEKHRTRSLRSLLDRVLQHIPLGMAEAILDSITFSEISLLVTELGHKSTEIHRSCASARVMHKGEIGPGEDSLLVLMRNSHW